MRISDWSSDVCSSDLLANAGGIASSAAAAEGREHDREHAPRHGIVERTGGQRERPECGVGEATFVDDAREHRASGERDARAHEQSRAALTQSCGEEAWNVEQEGRKQRSQQAGQTGKASWREREGHYG